jgi:hypothetical protein
MGQAEQSPFRAVSHAALSCYTPHKGTVPCARYSPMNYVDKWTTPQLLIHGSKDYRLPETESIGAFHALQQFVNDPLIILTRTMKRCEIFSL